MTCSCWHSRAAVLPWHTKWSHHRKFLFALDIDQTKVLRMTLKRGKYTAYCTAKDGKTNRMKVNLTVE